MNPHELLETLEERAGSERGLTDPERALLDLVRRVVARVDELAKLLFRVEPPKGESYDVHLKRHEVEMIEYIWLMGGALFGDLKPLPEPHALGIADAQIALKNRELWKRRAEARAEGWYIEAIALTAYELEDWLRVWIVSQGGGSTFHPDDRHQLTHLIDQAEKLSLEPNLVSRLRDFNRTRNRAIHRLLRGEIAYADLATAYDADAKLPGELTAWVIGRLPTFEEAEPEGEALSRWLQWADNPKIATELKLKMDSAKRELGPDDQPVS